MRVKYVGIQLWFFVVVEPNVVQPPTPCDPNPCGTNAQCKTRNGAIDCSCPGNYVGDPYSSCRPECVLNTDCPRDQSCSRNRCIDPCPGTCGLNTECRVSNHIPVCSCKHSHTGDPYGSCRPIPVISKKHEVREFLRHILIYTVMFYSTSHISVSRRETLRSSSLRTKQYL
jgi:hypothetical protein